MDYILLMTLYEEEDGGRDIMLLDQFTKSGRVAAPVFIHEFTPAALEDIGKSCVLRVVDATIYTPGMDRMCIDVRINGGRGGGGGRRANDETHTIAFRNNWNDSVIDLEERTRSVPVPFYKSVIVEYNLACMKGMRL